jgi:hypothetical protein
MSRRPFLALAAALAVALMVPTGRAHAQILGTSGADPFSLYFGYYLPHQAAVAAQPNALDTINQITAARGYAAVTDRAGLYDPISPYGDEELDPLRPIGSRRGGERLARPQLNPGSTSNARGTGPAMFYNRTARYYPQIRPGRGSNRNLAVTRGRGAGGGMPSLPGVR